MRVRLVCLTWLIACVCLATSMPAQPGPRGPGPGRIGPGPRPGPHPVPHPGAVGAVGAHRLAYQFRRNDWAYLHRYYRRNLAYINMASRAHFVAGAIVPHAYATYITPLPRHVYGYLAAPPPGYSMGYVDGYVVVYDPATFYIASVEDLLSQQ